MPTFQRVLQLSCLSLFFFVSRTSADGQGPSWTLLHSWDGKNFQPRGTVVTVTENNVESGDDDEPVLKVVNDPEMPGMSSDQIKAMLDYGWYHVSLVSNDEKDESRGSRCYDNRASL